MQMSDFPRIFFSSRVSVKGTKPSLSLFQPKINSKKMAQTGQQHTSDLQLSTQPLLSLGKGECWDAGTFRGDRGDLRPYGQRLGAGAHGMQRGFSEAHRSKNTILNISHLEMRESKAPRHRKNIHFCNTAAVPSHLTG